MTNPRHAYRENDVRGATAMRLVILLYEQLIHDLNQAAEAIERNDIELRTERINHAILVIAHLQSPLDFAAGGKVAHDLDLFYNTLRKRLVEIQFRPSKNAMRQQITDLLTVREAWIEVERSEKLAAVSPHETAPAGGTASQSTVARMNWKG
jgi:flagellar secretion chaperone FliS